jgi:hypothetical protein
LQASRKSFQKLEGRDGEKTGIGETQKQEKRLVMRECRDWVVVGSKV